MILRHMHRYLTVAWLAALFIPAMWAIDREPPFEVLGYIEPPPVKRGQSVTFVFPVRRDVDRDCSVSYSRVLLDAAGDKHDYPAGTASAQGLRLLEQRMGPYLRQALLVPPAANPGRATMVTELDYRCNPLHALFPIHVTLKYPFEVLP